MTRDYAKFYRDYPNATYEQIERNAWRYDTNWVNRARLAATWRRAKTELLQLLEPIVAWMARALDHGFMRGKRSAPATGDNSPPGSLSDTHDGTHPHNTKGDDQ